VALAVVLATGAALTVALAVSDAAGVAVFGCSWLLPHATTVATTRTRRRFMAHPGCVLDY